MALPGRRHPTRRPCHCGSVDGSGSGEDRRRRRRSRSRRCRREDRRGRITRGLVIPTGRRRTAQRVISLGQRRSTLLRLCRGPLPRCRGGGLGSIDRDETGRQCRRRAGPCRRRSCRTGGSAGQGANGVTAAGGAPDIAEVAEWASGVSLTVGRVGHLRYRRWCWRRRRSRCRWHGFGAGLRCRSQSARGGQEARNRDLSGQPRGRRGCDVFPLSHVSQVSSRRRSIG